MPSPTSRRQFITASAAAAGSLAAPYILRGQDGTQEFKVGLIGCGGRGSGAADQTLSVTGPNVKLVAVGDVFKPNADDALRQLKNKHGAKVDVPDERKFSGFDAYQNVLSVPGLNVVILATPPGFRPFHFEAAIKAGKHVFMEKPVCVDSHGAQMAMRAAKEADQKGLKVVVGLQRRYQNSYLETLKRIQEGVIGDIVSAQVYWNGGRPWVRDRQQGDTEMIYQVRNWYHFNWLCGDNICEQHIHNIDVANWFLGDKPPVRARGMGGRQTLTEKKYGEIFDHHYVEFIYDNGVIVNSQCRHAPNTWSQVSESFVGTKGTGQAGILRDHAGKVLWRHPRDVDPNPYQTEHDRLYEAIVQNKPLNNAHYGTNSSFTSVLGRYCTYSGKEITWDDALNCGLRLTPEDFGPDAQPKVMPDNDGNYPVAIPGKFDWKTGKNA
ncbi:MAG: Gfo/Idh/MocA family protein [Verrucomicrobiales bacterium]